MFSSHLELLRVDGTLAQLNQTNYFVGAWNKKFAGVVGHSHPTIWNFNRRENHLLLCWAATPQEEEGVRGQQYDYVFVQYFHYSCPKFAAWYQYGTSMVLVWFQHGTSMVLAWYEHGTSMVLAWYQHGHITVLSHYWHRTVVDVQLYDQKLPK